MNGIIEIEMPEIDRFQEVFAKRTTECELLAGACV